MTDLPHGTQNGVTSGEVRDSRGPDLPPAAAGPGSSAVQERLAHLLDRAHEALPAHELAALLLAVGRMTDPPGRLLAAPTAPALRPAARAAHLDPIVRTLARAEGAPDGLGAWLRDYLDELAARPRGSALWKAA